MSLKAGVVSAGSWGTALAALLAGKNYDVRIWARENEIVDSINSRHENELFLPGIKLPENLSDRRYISGCSFKRPCCDGNPGAVLKGVVETDLVSRFSGNFYSACFERDRERNAENHASGCNRDAAAGTS